LVIIIIVGVEIGMAAYKGHALYVESKAFVDGAVPAIAAQWSKDQLLDRATPELRQSTTDDQMTAFFDTLSRLGPLIPQTDPIASSGSLA
jgi:hypothetical protein